MLSLELRVSHPASSATARPVASDIAVRFAQSSTVGDVAAALAEQLGMPGTWTLCVDDRGGTVLDPATEFGVAHIRRGDRVSLVSPGRIGSSNRSRSTSESQHRLVLVEGPNAPAAFVLQPGANPIGRNPSHTTICLNDPSVSSVHAEVIAGEPFEIVDKGSTNKVVVDGAEVQRARLDAGALIRLGDSVLQFEPGRHLDRSSEVDLQFNRSPRVFARFRSEKIEFPEAPEKPKSAKFPWVTLAGTLLMALVMIIVTSSRGGSSFAIFYVMSPMLLVAGIFESRRSGKADFIKAKLEWWEASVAVANNLRQLAFAEKDLRKKNLPGAADLVPQALRHQLRLWEREPTDDDFLSLRVGLAKLPTAHEIEVSYKKGDQESIGRLRALVESQRYVEGMPVSLGVRERGAIAIVGARRNAITHAASYLTQLFALHSPSEAVLAALLSDQYALDRWDWIKWLPHVRSANTVLQHWPIAVGENDAQPTLSAIEATIDRRAEGQPGSEAEPAVVVLVDGALKIERSRMQRLLETGPPTRVYFVWIDERVEYVPLGCRAMVLINQTGDGGELADAETGERVVDVALDSLDEASSRNVALALAPLTDANRKVYASGNLPDGVTLVELLGDPDVLNGPASVLRWWSGEGTWWGNELGASDRHGHLHILLGAFDGGTSNRLVVDLRKDGPHALIAGTTGSGKSELLQTMVTSMAATYGPAEVNFLFVDYKGGAAFGKCVQFPHSVGMITDLDIAEVRRVETSLRAELHRREELLNKYRRHAPRDMADLAELVRQGRADAADLPASLVIVVDEFAALREEIPEFVDGVVDIAARGRSLGMHLILATQNPATSINDNIRSNTNLRIALRVAAPENSNDVLRSPAAAFFPKVPGRGAVRRGAQDVEVFQSAYVGDTGEPPRAEDIEALSFTLTGATAPPAPPETEPTWYDHALPEERRSHLARLSEVFNQAADTLRAAGTLGHVYIPWRPPLPEAIPLVSPDRPVLAHNAALFLGVQDIPEHQTYADRYHDFDNGNLHIFGGGSSGKTSALRSLALATSVDSAANNWSVYVLDFAGLQLGALEELASVGSVLGESDVDRVIRLITWLAEEIQLRVSAQSARGATSFEGLNDLLGHQRLPRILLMVDGFDSFYGFLDAQHRQGEYVGMFRRICQEGRAAGVHVVLTSTRSNEGDGPTRSAMSTHLVMSGPPALLIDHGVKADVLPEDPPPGRCTIDKKHQLQLAVPADVEAIRLRIAEDQPPMESDLDNAEAPPLIVTAEDQTALIEAWSLPVPPENGRFGNLTAAQPSTPSVPNFPDLVASEQLDHRTVREGELSIGLGHARLRAALLSTRTPTAIHGPPGSGKTTALATIALASVTHQPDRPVWWLSGEPAPEGLHAEGIAVRTGQDVGEAIQQILSNMDAGLYASHGLTLLIDEVCDLAQEDRSVDHALTTIIGALGKVDVHLVLSADIRRFDPSALGSFRRFKGTGPTGIALDFDRDANYPLFDGGRPPNAMNWLDSAPGRAVMFRRGHDAEVVQVAHVKNRPYEEA